MIRAVIFDCFGVLISDALTVMVTHFEMIDPEGAAQIRQFVGLSNRGIIDPEESNRNIARIMGLEYAAYRQQIIKGEVKDPQVMAYVKTLRTNYKTALLSNISSSGLRKRFTDEELEGHFDVVVASSDIGYAKPEAQAYEITAERLGVTPEACIFIDDRDDYCQAAQAVGMQALTYRSFKQLQTDLAPLLQGT